MPRIMVIHPDKDQCSDIKFLLYLHGYQAETCQTLEEGVNRFMIFEELERSFDLVLLMDEQNQLQMLEKCTSNTFLEKLVVVKAYADKDRSSASNQQSYKICRPELVLDYVRQHLESVQDSGRAMSADGWS